MAAFGRIFQRREARQPSSLPEPVNTELAISQVIAGILQDAIEAKPAVKQYLDTELALHCQSTTCTTADLTDAAAELNGPAGENAKVGLNLVKQAFSLPTMSEQQFLQNVLTQYALQQNYTVIP